MYGDPHWSGTASWLSGCEIWPIRQTTNNLINGITGSSGFRVRAGKTFDQYVADKFNSPLRSFHVAFEHAPHFGNGQSEDMGMDYVNYLSWKSEFSPNSNEYNPVALFNHLYGAPLPSGGSSQSIQQALIRQKSIMDGVVDQIKSLNRKVAAADKTRLESYFDGIREIEKQLTARLTSGLNQCNREEDGSIGSADYNQKFRSFQKIIIKAMQCNAINSATLMYNNGIGETGRVHPEFSDAQHPVSHSKNEDRVKKITRLQVQLFAEFVRDIKSAGLLPETIVMLGSNMSDGDLHVDKNIPLLICGEGNDLRFGETLNIADNGNHMDTGSCRQMTDIMADLSKTFGLEKTSFGETEYQSSNSKSTGRPTGIFRV
jgi:hypothetical protein